MLTRTIVIFYRIVAITILLTPIVLNVIDQGEILYSLVYLPLMLLAFTLLFIWLDKNIKSGLTYLRLNRQSAISKLLNVETTSVKRCVNAKHSGLLM